MFLGEYSHTVDSKGRVFIPAKYREELGSKFVITKSTDKCLSVYPMEYWNAYVAKIEALPTAQAVKIRRFVFAQACDVEQDSQGRALLSQSLRDYAEIKDNAVVIGLGSYLEIWSGENWSAASADVDAKEVEELMIGLGF